MVIYGNVRSSVPQQELTPAVRGNHGPLQDWPSEEKQSKCHSRTDVH